MRTLTVVGTLLLSSPHTAEAQRLIVAHWGMFEERRLGTRVEYPVDVFSISEGASERGIGEHFRTADGRAQLIIYSLPAEAGDTPASFLRKNLVVQLAASDYRRVTASFFAISAHRNGVIYYSRCNFSSNGGGACTPRLCSRQKVGHRTKPVAPHGGASISGRPSALSTGL